jgi:hypothetical protein
MNERKKIIIVKISVVNKFNKPIKPFPAVQTFDKLLLDGTSISPSHLQMYMYIAIRLNSLVNIISIKLLKSIY